MKNCNNCGTENIDSVTNCTNCNMANDFTFTGLPLKKAPVKIENHTCSNCGTSEMGGGKRCIQCNFPLPVEHHQETQIVKPLSNQKSQAS